MNSSLAAAAVCLGLLAGCWNRAGASEEPDSSNSTAAAANNASSASAAMGSSAAVMVAPAAKDAEPDPCFLPDVVSNPTRPNWDTSAQTTQCGLIEVDSGWMWQPMGGGMNQRMWMSSMRYGLTSRLDLRWGMTHHIAQSGRSHALEGVGDQWFSGRYRILEQGHMLPAMAFLYAYKAPTANPAKGFGSGFSDNQFILIASRDVGKNHFDFNIVGTVAGQAHGHDGAAQFGLALTRPVSKKLSWMLESYGGPQPGTAGRFGAAFTGAAYTLRPAVVIDAAYSRTYTAGTPRGQILFGCTYAIRPGFPPLARGSALRRILGR